MADTSIDPGEGGSFAFVDVEQLREHTGSAPFTAEHQDEYGESEALLIEIGVPQLFFFRVEGQDLSAGLRDIGQRARWTSATYSGGAQLSSSGLEEMPKGLAKPLSAAGWQQVEEDTFFAGDIDYARQGGTRVVEMAGDRLVTTRPPGDPEKASLEETREYREEALKTPLGDDESFTSLRDCIGDRPVAVSLSVNGRDEAGIPAYAVVTDLVDGDLSSRACALGATPEKLKRGSPLGRGPTTATDIQMDGPVASASLELGAPDAPAPHASLHRTFPERTAPGY